MLSSKNLDNPFEAISRSFAVSGLILNLPSLKMRPKT